MSNQSHSQHSAVDDVEIDGGTVGTVGHSQIGVAAIKATPPPVQGAMPGAQATTVVVREIAGVHTESTLTVSQRMLLPLDDGMHRIDRLSPPGNNNRRGELALAAEAAQSVAPDAVFLGKGGRLRIGGPDVDDATDLRILTLSPDDHAPQQVTVEWLPAAYAREDTPARLIKQQTLKTGDKIQAGKATLTVKAIEGANQDHPAWVVFMLAPGR